MSRERAINNLAAAADGIGTLAADITSGATTITLSAAVAISTDQFMLRIENELLRVVSGGGTATLTVVRGAEGSTAAPHLSGDVCFAVLTRSSLERQLLQKTVVGAWSGFPAAVHTPALAGDRYIATEAISASEAVHDGTNWRYILPPYGEVTPPDASLWTASYNDTTAVELQSNAAAMTLFVGPSANPFGQRGYKGRRFTIPSDTQQVWEVGMFVDFMIGNYYNLIFGWGLIGQPNIRGIKFDGQNSREYHLYYDVDFFYGAGDGTAVNGRDANHTNLQRSGSRYIWYRLERDGAERIGYYSNTRYDGSDWRDKWRRVSATGVESGADKWTQDFTPDCLVLGLEHTWTASPTAAKMVHFKRIV